MALSKNFLIKVLLCPWHGMRQSRELCNQTMLPVTVSPGWSDKNQPKHSSRIQCLNVNQEWGQKSLMIKN
jgi:hypothetical protein